MLYRAPLFRNNSASSLSLQPAMSEMLSKVHAGFPSLVTVSADGRKPELMSW
jgi:hypothetical protein